MITIEDTDDDDINCGLQVSLLAPGSWVGRGY
jgi:hypothetical protein